jgi:hypothetical protein
MCIHPGASPTFGGWRTMEAETRHLPEYRCLAPSLRPVTKPHWLRSPRCGFEQRFLNGNGPAQVGLGSFEPHRLYIKTERSVPATHANVQHRKLNIDDAALYRFKTSKPQPATSPWVVSIRLKDSGSNDSLRRAWSLRLSMATKPNLEG